MTITVFFLLVHGLLFSFGLANDNALLSGDRATSRDATIAYVFNIEKINNSEVSLKKPLAAEPSLNFSDRIASSGHAGDYIIQGAILKLTNGNVLVVIQLALAMFSTLCVLALMLYFGFSEKTATLATLLYLFLPGSLLPAHQLGSEAIFIPCMITGLYLLIISSQRQRTDIVFIAGLLALSVALFVRPQLSLFPFLLVIIYWCFSKKKANTIVTAVVPLSLFFSVIWMFFVLSENGEFSFGGEDRSIGLTFYETAEQMAMSDDISLDSYTSRSLSLYDFAGIVIDHPYSYIRQRFISMTNFFVNPGANTLFVDHLNCFEKNSDFHYWQHLRARSGIYGSIVEVIKRGPLFSVMIFITALTWCLVLLSAVAGMSRFIKDRNVGNFAKALLLSLAGYQVGIVLLLSVGARWQQRSLIDFIIILLAAYGLGILRKRLWPPRRLGKPIPLTTG